MSAVLNNVTLFYIIMLVNLLCVNSDWSWLVNVVSRWIILLNLFNVIRYHHVTSCVVFVEEARTFVKKLLVKNLSWTRGSLYTNASTIRNKLQRMGKGRSEGGEGRLLNHKGIYRTKHLFQPIYRNRIYSWINLRYMFVHNAVYKTFLRLTKKWYFRSWKLSTNIE